MELSSRRSVVGSLKICMIGFLPVKIDKDFRDRIIITKLQKCLKLGAWKGKGRQVKHVKEIRLHVYKILHWIK